MIKCALCIPVPPASSVIFLRIAGASATSSFRRKMAIRRQSTKRSKGLTMMAFFQVFPMGHMHHTDMKYIDQMINVPKWGVTIRCDLIVEYCRKSYYTSGVRYTNGKPVHSATLQNPGDGHLHLWGCHGWKAWVRSTGTQPCSRTCTNFKCFPIRAGVLLHHFAPNHCRTPHLVQSSLSAHMKSQALMGVKGGSKEYLPTDSSWIQSPAWASYSLAEMDEKPSGTKPGMANL